MQRHPQLLNQIDKKLIEASDDVKTEDSNVVSVKENKLLSRNYKQKDFNFERILNKDSKMKEFNVEKSNSFTNFDDKYKKDGGLNG